MLLAKSVRYSPFFRNLFSRALTLVRNLQGILQEAKRSQGISRGKAVAAMWGTFGEEQRARRSKPSS